MIKMPAQPQLLYFNLRGLGEVSAFPTSSAPAVSPQWPAIYIVAPRSRRDVVLKRRFAHADAACRGATSKGSGVGAPHTSRACAADVAFSSFPAQAPRLVLRDQGVKYDEQYPPPGTWADMKRAGTDDGTLPFGQLPRFTDEDGTAIVQSGAILRYLARKFDLYGADAKEAALIDQVYEEAGDWRRAYGKLVYEKALEAGAVAAYKATLADRHARGGGWLGHIEAFAAKHGGPYLTGAKVSIADYVLFDLVNTHLRPQFMPELLDAYPVPTLKAWYAVMAARPGIAEYIASDAPHRKAANGNDLA
jgi:glutathione S-transferase